MSTSVRFMQIFVFFSNLSKERVYLYAGGSGRKNGNFLLLLLFSMNFLVQMIKERKKLSSLIFDNSKCMGRDQSMRRRKKKNKHHLFCGNILSLFRANLLQYNFSD